MERRLIRRKKLVPDPKRTIVATEENTTSYSPPLPNHQVYALIGQITMRWSFVEELLDNCIGTLADTEPAITACITAQMMGHAPRCLTIKALAHWRGLHEIEKAIDGLQNKLFEASELRNRAIHDRLLIKTKTKATFKEHRMSKKELHYGLKEFDDTELNRAIDLIEKRRIDCVNLHTMILEEVYEYYS
jgi:hypothetical protein